MSLTENQKDALAWLAGSKYWEEPPTRGAAIIFAALARKGLAHVQQNSEHLRGETRTFWNEYQINVAGRAAISKVKPA